MTKEYGGYLPLELNDGEELFDQYRYAKVARFNCGRASIAAAIKSLNPNKLYIPYYNCEVVRDTLRAENIEYELYLLDEHLEPQIDGLGANDWILYVHYFGTFSEEKINHIARKYRNVVFDNTQAFYAKPVLDGNCMNVYSPRKFIGLIDGGYLIWSGDREIFENYPQDVSWERGAFLLKSIELGTDAAYMDNLESKECFSQGIKKMSVLTQKMLKSVDYSALAAKRDKNYRCLIKKFAGINQLDLPLEGYAPFVYPLLIEDTELRRKIVEKKIYVPQWWKYLLTEVPDDSIEAKLSKWLLPFPIDQRYSESDMEDMSTIILNLLK